jgi:hypothetical protein
MPVTFCGMMHDACCVMRDRKSANLEFRSTQHAALVTVQPENFSFIRSLTFGGIGL